MAHPQWKKWLEPYIADDSVQPNGDQNLHCPIHGDSRRSATINFVTGEWYCFACEEGGTIEKLIERKADWFAPGESPSKTVLAANQRALPDSSRLDGWTSALLSNAEMMDWLANRRGIDANTITRFGLGLNDGWLMIPVNDKDGQLVNIRQYNRNATDGAKVMHWRGWGRPIRLYPIETLLEDPPELYIVEGELDAIIGNMHGLPTITCTGGVKTLAKWSNPEWTEWVRGRTLTLIFDCDPIGRKSAKALAEKLSPEAKSVRIVKLPYRSNSKKDLTDFFVDGHTADELESFIETTQTKRTNGKRTKSVDYKDLKRPSQVRGQAVSVQATPSAVFQSQSILPTSLTAKCSMDWIPAKCKHCPIAALNGKRTVNVEHDDPLWMDLLNGTLNSKAKQTLFKEKLQVPAGCPQAGITDDSVGVWPGEIRNGSNLAEDAFPVVMVLEGQSPTLNQPADLEGSVVTSTKGARSVLVAYRYTSRKRDLDSFVPDQSDIVRARQFVDSLNGAPHERLDQIAELFEKHVTHIYGQRLLHKAIDLVYHSVTKFRIGHAEVNRGWMELLAVGETRSGKSTAATRMLELFGYGHLVGAENASIAGLLGGLEKSSGGIGGEGFIRRAGTLPLNHRRLIIFDEAQGLQISDISRMSDVRSRGMVQIEKIQHIEADAQVRLIWLSNPRDGKKYHRGIDALQDQMGAPEDLSRIDIPIFVRANVGDAFKQTHVDYGRLRVDPDIFEWLVLWAWSRQPDEIVWTADALADVWDTAEQLAVEFETDVPIFQHNEAHIRLGRMAVALSARLFSTDNGRRVIVDKEQVRSAAELYRQFLAAEDLGISAMKEDITWRAKQETISGPTVEGTLRGLSVGERQQIVNGSDFDRVFGNHDRRDFYQSVFSNGGALYDNRGRWEWSSWAIDMLKDIHEELK